MANQAYAHIDTVQANIIDMPGDAAPGGQVIYSAIVIDLSNNVVAQPNSGNPGVMYVGHRPLTFSVLTALNLNKLQTLIIADIQALYADNSIQVTFL